MTNLPILTRDMTAYEFLTEFMPVLIREEPRRMHMREWTCFRHEDTADQEDWPSCGTIACIGGWTEISTGAGWHDLMTDIPEPHLLSKGRGAAAILGLVDEMSDELFCPKYLMWAENQGTPEHAEAVIAHLLRFAEKYEYQLKRTTVHAPRVVTSKE